MQPSDDEKKIASVFEELGRLKILAKTNYLCCGGCAHSDLHRQVEQSGGKYTGYAFYHEQDDELVRGRKGPLYIGFGSIAESVRGVGSVGRKVKKELSAEGFTVEWNGEADTRIQVTELFFEPYETCNGCGLHVPCECCYSCDRYPCECEEEEE